MTGYLLFSGLARIMEKIGMKTGRRLFSLLLCFVLVLSMLPAAAAESGEELAQPADEEAVPASAQEEEETLTSEQELEPAEEPVPEQEAPEAEPSSELPTEEELPAEVELPDPEKEPAPIESQLPTEEDAEAGEPKADEPDVSAEIELMPEPEEPMASAEEAANAADGAEEEADDPAEEEEELPWEFEVEGLEESVIPEGGESGDILLQGYFDQQVQSQLPVRGRGLLRAPINTGARLTGTNAAFYTILKERISQVAAGNAASTEFTIDRKEVEALGYRTHWTAEELGVSELIGADGKLTSEATQAVKAKLGVDLNGLIRALLADCPYELYWYYKTVSTKYTPGKSWSRYTDGSIGPKEFIFKFPVSEDYANPDSVANPKEVYSVDQEKCQSVQSAVENAVAIVTENQSASDYDKLHNYLNTIQELSDYDYSAAGGSVPYGDPWQMISVFDGNPETKVVCEGYSKAYQYLCDKSSFISSAITCCSVTGLFNTEKHMWNIVSMDDGRNYLVDVTNSTNDNLFLKGYTSIGTSNNYKFGSAWYQYDQSALNLFTAEELKLSAADYGQEEPTVIRVEDQQGVLYEVEDGEARVTGYSSLSGAITIPETVNGAPVRSIQDGAFQRCAGLTKLTLPAGIQNIGNDVVSGCDQLRRVVFTGKPLAYRDDLKFETVVLYPATAEWEALDSFPPVSTDVWVPYYENDPDKNFRVSFDANGGSSAPGTIYKQYNVALTLPTEKPYLKNYEFRGWATTPDATKAEYAAGEKFLHNADLSLYAIWRKYDKIGWVKEGGEQYYYEDGAPLTGWVKDGGKWYYMNSSGVMQTGWVKDGGKWYFLNSFGVMQTGWVDDGGKWYYMSASGAMQTGWVKVSGKWYYMNGSGVMQTGWVKLSGKWYYMNGSGEMQTGWVKVSGKWYYMNSSGVMQTGWVKASGKWYYMNSSGVMQTGWVKIGNYWYWFNGSGVMASTGTYTISGKKYRFDSSGHWVA